jgi:hypothetical protein
LEAQDATSSMNFTKAFNNLQGKFAARAADDGHVYLPNFTPFGRVDAVVVAMQPSLGRWARTPPEAAKKVDEGFRNFMWSPEDFILHWAARRSFYARAAAATTSLICRRVPCVCTAVYGDDREIENPTTISRSRAGLCAPCRVSRWIRRAE